MVGWMSVQSRILLFHPSFSLNNPTVFVIQNLCLSQWGLNLGWELQRSFIRAPWPHQ